MKKTNILKFKRLLSELFMFDYADLDFGIYRIMNAKREEFRRFLDDDLLPQVRKEIEHLGTGKREDLLNQRAQIIQQLQDLQVPNPETNPKVLEIDEKLENTVDVTALENDIFSDLYDFFSRYYSEGDYMSLRRYKEGVYAIPYEGEEVKLHWANADQYYIKTSEYFRDYTFRLPDHRRVHFKLTSADTEQNNNKTSGKEKRAFVLCDEDFIAEEDGDLVIRFEYRLVPKKRKQSNLNDEAVERILAVSDFQSWMMILGRPAPTEKNADRRLLHKYLADYTSRNTFDYFIHKDLGGFLRRELDFFIKNEIMHLDDIESASTPRVESYLSKIKALRRVANKVIAFLEQLENFQKKLWLKKKFVIETNYCITLDRVPEELYPEIAANDAQREEWVKLFAIDQIRGDLIEEQYTEPLSIAFLQQNQYLLIDTKLYDEEFKYRLLGYFDDLDDEIDGLLINSENFQALNFLSNKYANQIRCYYIDPPYNTGSDGFVYKDRYRHSSWLSMISDRLKASNPLASEKSVFFSSIDDNEITNFRKCLNAVLGKENFVSQIIIQSNKRGRTYQSIAKTHEYLLVYNMGENSEISEIPKDVPSSALTDKLGVYELWELRNRNPKFGRHNRPNLYYPIYAAPENLDDNGYAPISLEKSEKYYLEILPKNSEGEDSCWRWGKDKVQRAISKGDTTVLLAKEIRDGSWNVYQKARKNTKKVKSIWTETDVINEQGTVQVGHLGLTEFGFPKPVGLLEKIIQIGADYDSFIMDYFAGSGTTGHAVINLNREDNGDRKYILVEMGSYFDTVLKPRIQKAIYSQEWKNGKPINREGISHFFKYIKMESYEDTLNNLHWDRTPQQQSLLDQFDDLRQDYMLNYMLEVEAKHSASLLDIQQFVNPFNYQMHINTGTVDETQLTTIDLVETFNYLLGIQVHQIQDFKHIRMVKGQNREDQSVLIIWRNQEEIDNEALDAFFLDEVGVDTDSDLIYVNGDNHLENLKTGNEAWQVRLVEPTFHDLMFDVQDV